MKYFISYTLFLCMAFGNRTNAHAQATEFPEENKPTTISPPVPITVYPNLTNYSNTTNRNFVRVFAPTKPISNSADATLSALTPSHTMPVSVAYFDGLARPLQEITRAGALGNFDLVTCHVYDGSGKESFKYQPFNTDNVLNPSGKLNTQPLSRISALYSAKYPGEHPFGQTTFDQSPFNRVVTKMGPGVNWVGAGRGAEFSYRSNTSQEDIRIWTIGNGSSDLPITTAAYLPGELSVTEVQDEDGGRTLEYKTKSEQVILIKKYVYDSHGGNGGDAMTYYVYDDFGRLRYVIPPLAIEKMNTLDVTSVTNLCYSYFYDTRSRLIERKIADKGKEQFVYDAKDRLVLSRDET